jgi:hypothetical protein
MSKQTGNWLFLGVLVNFSRKTVKSKRPENEVSVTLNTIAEIAVFNLSKRQLSMYA